MNRFKKVISIILMLTTALLFVAMIKPSQKSDWEIVSELCEGYSRIQLIDTNEMTLDEAWRVINNRKDKPYVVVEKIISVSNGDGYGWYKMKGATREYIIGYNETIKKGEPVISYVIWNPETDICDDVLFVVDSKKFR